MPINSVALIAGTLSFSAALAWNKAISDSLTQMTGNQSSLLQALVITIIIIIVVYSINMGLKIYTAFSNTNLKDSVINSGDINGAKVKLWNKNNN
jgi:hypothetical protein